MNLREEKLEELKRDHDTEIALRNVFDFAYEHLIIESGLDDELIDAIEKMNEIKMKIVKKLNDYDWIVDTITIDNFDDLRIN